MSRYYRSLVVIENDSGASEDRFVNTFHFKSDEVDSRSTEVGTISTALRALYQALDGTILSAEIGASFRIVTYDLTETTPRAPIGDVTEVMTPSSTALPNEVALCVSYRGAITSGVNRRRNRGRIYLGPLASNTTDGTGDRTVDSGWITSLLGWFDTFAEVDLQLGASEIRWCVFSRAEALGLGVGTPVPNEGVGFTYTEAQLDDGMRPISTITIDNAFDTQRRRGRLATTRSSTIVAGV